MTKISKKNFQIRENINRDGGDSNRIYQNNFQTGHIESDLTGSKSTNYNKMERSSLQNDFKIFNGNEIGKIGQDDGYSSETTRTSNSSASELNQSANNNGSFVFSVLDDVNFGSNDVNNEDFHEMLKAAEHGDDRTQKDEEKGEETEENRKSIHSKLETLLKAKVKSINSRTLPNKKSDLKFPDPLISEASRTLPSNGSDHSDRNYLAQDEQIVNLYSEKDYFETTLRPINEALIFTGTEENKAIENKATMMSELRKSIVGLHEDEISTSYDDVGCIKRPDNNYFMMSSSEQKNSPHHDGEQFKNFTKSPTKEISLYDSFPLHFSPKQTPIKMVPVPVKDTDAEMVHQLDQAVNTTDETAISRKDVLTMLKSHLNGKNDLENGFSEGFVSISKTFSFTSKDMEAKGYHEDEKKGSEEQSIVFEKEEDGEFIQQQLILESEKPETTILDSASFKRNRIEQASHVNDDVFNLSLTDSEYEFVREKSEAINPEDRQDIESESLKTELDNSDKIDINIVDDSEMEDIAGIENKAETPQEFASTPEIERNELQYESKADKQPLSVSDLVGQPPKNKGANFTEYYWPVEHEERLIKPSEYQVHRFSERKKFSATQEQNRQPIHAQMKIDTSGMQKTKQTAGNTNATTFTRRQQVDIATDKIRSAAEIEKPIRRPIVVETGMPIQFAPSNTQVSSNSKRPNSSNEKWTSQIYTNTQVGKINIPTNFRSEYSDSLRVSDNIKIERQTSSSRNSTSSKNVTDISPRPSTPKKSRKFSLTKDKTDPAESTPRSIRESSSQSIGNKLKMFFSPNSRRRNKKRDSVDDFLSVAEDDITRRRNINSTWGFDDNNSTLSGYLTPDKDIDHDDIDVDFVSNQEWLKSQNENSWKTRSQTKPLFKQQLLPNRHTKRKNQSMRSNTSMRAIRGVGKVIVPDVFSEQNGQYGPVKFTQSRSNSMPIVSVVNKRDKNNNSRDMELVVNDVVFNSLDVNRDEVTNNGYRNDSIPVITSRR